MLDCFIDFETRSAADLGKQGVHVYAEHPSTDIICVAYVVRDDRKTIIAKGVWFPVKFRPKGGITNEELMHDTKDCRFIAHNASFERVLWRVGQKKYGWVSCPPVDKWVCTMARAKALGLPPALEMVGKTLKLITQKDMEGHKLMMRMCKPRSPLKNEKTTPDENGYLWRESPEDIKRLAEYCMADVLTEIGVYDNTRALSRSEQKVWELQEEINDRGFHIDVPSAKACQELIVKENDKFLKQVKVLTGGRINSPRQQKEMLKWLGEQGLALPDIKVGTVKTALTMNITAESRQLLEIRQELGKSAVSKVKAILKNLCTDETVKGSVTYHVATTGRFGGKRVQPHNFTKGAGIDVNHALSLIKQKRFETLNVYYGSALDTISSCLRGLIVPQEGNDFLCGDFASIEMVNLNWYIDNQVKLDRIRKKEDVYKYTASDIYKIPVEEVSPAQRQIGKTAELGLGYGMGVEKFTAKCKEYGIDLGDHPHEFAEKIVYTWRKSNPLVIKFWREMEETVKHVIRYRKIMRFNRLVWGVQGDWLFCKLPSGRLMAYYKPHLTTHKGYEDSIAYEGIDSETLQWGLRYSYGGKLVENVVQATCRDLLVFSIINAEKAGFKTVLHVHDEILSEVLEGTRTIEEFEEITGRTPVWAEGCPVSVKAWRGKRYKK